MESSALVLDANILIRAVLGERVFELLLQYADTVRFFAPELAFHEAETHLPRILARHGIPEAKLHYLSRRERTNLAQREAQRHAGYAAPINLSAPEGRNETRHQFAA